MPGSMRVERRHIASESTVNRVLQGDLEALDGLDAEDVGVFCWSDVRPLAGPAGFLDWRLCGALSRTMEQRLFEARRAEVLLVPAAGRTRLRRVFVFGLGPAQETSDTVLRHVCRQAYEVMQRAGVGKLVWLAPTARRRPDLEEVFLRAMGEELPGRVDLVLVNHKG